MKSSIFREVDSIRLTQLLIDKLVNDKQLVNQGYVESILNFNNDFEVFGPHLVELTYDLKDNESNFDFLTNEVFKNEVPVGLRKSWNRLFYTPASKVKNYLGEKIAMYFEFLMFYTRMLILPSLIGIVVFSIQLNFKNGETITDVVNVIFSVLMLVWSVAFFELWRK